MIQEWRNGERRGWTMESRGQMDNVKEGRDAYTERGQGREGICRGRGGMCRGRGGMCRGRGGMCRGRGGMYICRGKGGICWGGERKNLSEIEINHFNSPFTRPWSFEPFSSAKPDGNDWALLLRPPLRACLQVKPVSLWCLAWPCSSA